MRGNLIEIAVGLILALEFAGVVTAFTDVVMSFVGAIFGGGPTELELLTEIRDELRARRV